MTFKFQSAAEFSKAYEGAELPELLRYAGTCIEAGNLGRACWHLADAGIPLRNRMVKRVPGLDILTNRCAFIGGNA